MKRIKTLEAKLNELESHVSEWDALNEKVSKASIGWHLDHGLKVINAVCSNLKSSNPEEYKWKFNFWRVFCFSLGFFPRGRAKAPKAVRPPEDVSVSDFKSQLNQAREYVQRFKELPSKANVVHHIFGRLNRRESLSLLIVHTEHHLKIIREIRKVHP